MDTYVHPRYTPNDFGGVDSVIVATAVGDRWTIASSDPDADLIGWKIAGYTEVIVTLRNLETQSVLLAEFEGSLNRRNWFGLPFYNRETDTFTETEIVDPGDSAYETLDADRWHYLRVRVRESVVLSGESVVSYIAGIGAATI